MANPFDQFDGAAKTANPFDQFDAAAPATKADAKAPSLVDTIMSAVGVGDKKATGGITGLIKGDTAPKDTGTAMDTAAYFPRGVRRGLANIAGFPVDAMNAGLSLVGAGSKKPFLGSRFIDDAVGLPGKALAAGITAATGREVKGDLPPPQTAMQHILSRTGEEIGAAAVPVGTAINAGKMGVEAARKLPLLARMFVEPAAINPASFARKEAATAAAAGAGAGVANEVTDLMGAKPHGLVHNAGDVLGALSGAGVLGAARIAGKPIGDIWQALFARDKFSNRVVKDNVVDTLANNASTITKTPGEPVDTQPLVDAIMGGKKVSDTVPGFRDSVADRTADPGIAALEYGRQSGSNAGQYVGQRNANTAAIDEAIQRIAPTGSPGALRSELEAARTKKLDEANTTAATAKTEAETAAAGVAPQYTPQARGATIRTAADEAMQRFIAETQAAHGTATRTADEAAARLPAQSDPATRGNVVRSTLEDRRDTARQATDDAYSNTANGGRKVDATPLTEALDRVNAGLTETERGLVPQGMIDRVRRLGVVPEPEAPPAPTPAQAKYNDRLRADLNRGEVTPLKVVDGKRAAEFDAELRRAEEAGIPQKALRDAQEAAPPGPAETPTARLKEATDLRSELLRKQRAALADPKAEQGGRNAARVIGKYVDATEDFIRSNLSPEELDALGIARATKTAEADSFTRAGDPVASVLQRFEGGNPRIRDERVAGQFVNPATDAPLTRLFAEADTPQVRNAIRDEIASKLPAEAHGDPAKLDRFTQDYEIPLRQFPGLRDEIATAASTRRQAGAAEEAVGARRQEFAGDSRALADVSARRADGTPAVLDEQIPGKFANPSGNRDLDALLNRADTPAVRGAIEDHILHDAAGSVGSADRITKFVTDYAEPLKRFPGLRDRLEGAAAARSRETAATADATALDTTLNKPGRSAVASYLRYGDERAQDAIKGVLAHDKPAEAMDELLNFAGNKPEAVEGARKAFWDLMQSRTRSAGETTKSMDGVQPWMPRALKGFLDDPANAAVAQRLYRDNPEHLEDVKKISDALQGVDLRTRAKAQNSSGTPQGVSAIMTPETLQSRFYAYKRGQTSLGFMVTALASVAARRAVRGAQGEAIEKLLDRALLDPELAATLLKENNPANRAALGRTAKGYLGNEADTIMKTISGDGKTDDETAGAAMRK